MKIFFFSLRITIIDDGILFQLLITIIRGENMFLLPVSMISNGIFFG